MATEMAERLADMAAEHADRNWEEINTESLASDFDNVLAEGCPHCAEQGEAIAQLTVERNAARAVCQEIVKSAKVGHISPGSYLVKMARDVWGTDEA